MSIFIGGPLDGKENYEVPPNLTNETRIPYQDFFPGHSEYEMGYYVYQFDGLAWRYVKTVKETHEALM